jgi:hypothetical protein
MVDIRLEIAPTAPTDRRHGWATTRSRGAPIIGIRSQTIRSLGDMHGLNLDQRRAAAQFPYDPNARYVLMWEKRENWYYNTAAHSDWTVYEGAISSMRGESDQSPEPLLHEDWERPYPYGGGAIPDYIPGVPVLGNVGPPVQARALIYSHQLPGNRWPFDGQVVDLNLTPIFGWHKPGIQEREIFGYLVNDVQVTQEAWRDFYLIPNRGWYAYWRFPLVHSWIEFKNIQPLWPFEFANAGESKLSSVDSDSFSRSDYIQIDNSSDIDCAGRSRLSGSSYRGIYMTPVTVTGHGSTYTGELIRGETARALIQCTSKISTAIPHVVWQPTAYARGSGRVIITAYFVAPPDDATHFYEVGFIRGGSTISVAPSVSVGADLVNIPGTSVVSVSPSSVGVASPLISVAGWCYAYGKTPIIYNTIVGRGSVDGSSLVDISGDVTILGSVIIDFHGLPSRGVATTFDHFPAMVIQYYSREFKAKTNYLRDRLMEHYLSLIPYVPPFGVYFALFSEDPTAAGDMSSELLYPGYRRTPITFDLYGGRIARNTNNMSWGVPPHTTWPKVSFWGVVDAPSAGNLLYFGTLGGDRSYGSGLTVEIPAMSCEIEES